MKNTIILLLTAGLLLAACVPAPTPAPVEQPVQPQPVVELPTQAPPPPPPEPTAVQPPAPQYAPFCQSAPVACQPPTIELRDNAFCVEKIPYAILAVPAGTTYESQDAGMECIDQATADGSLRITCHSKEGKQLWSYNLKVCNGSCSAPSLQMGTGQCPEGYGFDATNQCCAVPPAAGSEAGCIIYRVDIGGCPSG
jgi:hypothetical protein